MDVSSKLRTVVKHVLAVCTSTHAHPGSSSAQRSKVDGLLSSLGSTPRRPGAWGGLATASATALADGRAGGPPARRASPSLFQVGHPHGAPQMPTSTSVSGVERLLSTDGMWENRGWHAGLDTRPSGALSAFDELASLTAEAWVGAGAVAGVHAVAAGAGAAVGFMLPPAGAAHPHHTPAFPEAGAGSAVGNAAVALAFAPESRGTGLAGAVAQAATMTTLSRIEEDATLLSPSERHVRKVASVAAGEPAGGAAAPTPPGSANQPRRSCAAARGDGAPILRQAASYALAFAEEAATHGGGGGGAGGGAAPGGGGTPRTASPLDRPASPTLGPFSPGSPMPRPLHLSLNGQRGVFPGGGGGASGGAGMGGEGGGGAGGGGGGGGGGGVASSPRLRTNVAAVMALLSQPGAAHVPGSGLPGFHQIHRARSMGRDLGSQSSGAGGAATWGGGAAWGGGGNSPDVSSVVLMATGGLLRLASRVAGSSERGGLGSFRMSLTHDVSAGIAGGLSTGSGGRDIVLGPLSGAPSPEPPQRSPLSRAPSPGPPSAEPPSSEPLQMSPLQLSHPGAAL
jgi:hypothetical protein